MVQNTVKSSVESFKPGILKNERKKEITFNLLLAFQEGPHCQGQTDLSTPLYLRSCNKNCSLSKYLVN